MTATPVSFAGCFGWLHVPDSVPRTTGVVLCAPFGCELLWTHRSYRHLALALADAGFPTIRFDYHGTGDSLGGDDDPARVKAWLASIDAAIDTLKAATGVADVALFGLRLGGTLATAVAAQREDVPTLALWAPFPTGRAFIREARAFALLKNEPQGDDLQVAGFVIRPRTVEDLQALDVTATPPRSTRLLLLSRDDVPGDTKIAKHVAAHGTTVTESTVTGYAAMMRDPHQAEVPSAAIAHVVEWLAQTHLDRMDRVPTHHALDATLSDAGFHERGEVFGGRAKLFGIVCEPTQPRAKRPGVVLLNVGSNHHIGPNRMTVTLARELALQGFATLRFDIAGLGDSTPAPGEPENRLYSHASIDDAKTAMTFFATKMTSGGNGPFVLVGLCSGAYLAYYAAIADPRVREQVLINLQTFHWREGDSLDVAMRKSYKSTRFYRDAIFQRAAWQRLVRGQVNFRGIASAMAERLWTRAAHSVKELASREAAGVARTFKTLSERGTATFLLFSNEDAGIDEMEKHLGPSARRLRKHRHFRLSFVPDADHTFTPLAARRELIARITQHLQQRYP